jgi:tetratricopeptide (TPR) repeat protein
VATNTQNGEEKTNESGARPAAEMTGAANDGRRKIMLGNRKVSEVTPLLAALLAILFSVGTARAQSSDRRGLANSDRQSDFAVFSAAAHAPSPPSDLPKGNLAANGSAVSVHELSIPDKAREAYNKGIRQADADDWAGSVPNFQRAIKSFPAYYEAYSALGVAEVYLQSWNEAEASFRKCIQLSGGTFPVANFGLGMVLSHRKQFSEAEAMIREGIQLDPADARGHFSLAWVLHTMGRFPEAEQSAREAILYKPTFTDAFLLLAQIHLDQGNFSSEIEDLDGYLKLDPLGPPSARARAAIADAERSLTKENAAAHQDP